MTDDGSPKNGQILVSIIHPQNKEILENPFCREIYKKIQVQAEGDFLFIYLFTKLIFVCRALPSVFGGHFMRCEFFHLRKEEGP
jgi:hypothetical protein